VECKVQMKDRVRPVEGTAKAASSGGGTGQCPKCLTPGVLLSIVGGFIRKHTVSSVELPENNPQPATLVVERREHKHAGSKVRTGLSEPQTGLTDTGVRIGDPRAAEQRRVDQIEGAAGIGTVKVPRKVPGKGTLKSGAPRMTTKMVEVPATEEHVREALDYWRNRRVSERTSDAVRRQVSAMVSSLARRLEAIMAAQEVHYDVTQHAITTVSVPVGEQLALGASVDAAQGHRGPTLVRGRDTAPRVRDKGLPWDESTDLRKDGTVRKSTTLESPLGRERFDRKITTVPEPEPKRSKAWKRRQRARLLAEAYAKGTVGK
jgi:hypothetical protein